MAAAALAAAVGVYAEISYHENLKERARLQELRGLEHPAAPAASTARERAIDRER